MHTSRNEARTGAPWRVGVLFSRTGFMALIEETQLRGTLMAIEEINAQGGVNGREILPVLYDPASEPSSFGHYAKRLMVADDVTMIFGCYTSSSRKAVLPVVERLNGLLWYPTLYEGFELSPNVIYTGAAPNQNSVELCCYLMQRYGNRFFFIGSDYIYPRESNRIMREVVRRNGGTVVGETYLSLRAQRRDFRPVMRAIRELRPDAIFSTVVGDSTTYLYQSYAETGLDPKTTPIASLTTTETEIRAMGFDVGEHHITAAPYFQNVGGDSNASLRARVQEKVRRGRADQHVRRGILLPDAHLREGAGRDQLVRSGRAAPDGAGHRVRGATGTGDDQSREQPYRPVDPYRPGEPPRAVRSRVPVFLAGSRRPVPCRALGGRP